MLDKLNRLNNWQAALFLAMLGILLFLPSLNNPFQGDDISQIVNNPLIQSTANIDQFFKGSTFYNGQGLDQPLSGGLFRPLMMTIYTLIHTAFGMEVVYFHILQLAFHIGTAVLIFLFFRYTFKQAGALLLSTIFLIHPINSQVVLAIPSLQDTLYLFFGMLAILLLMKFHSLKSLFVASFCLFIALLSKEVAAVFILMSMIYLYMSDKSRLRKFTLILFIPVLSYIALRASAVGLITENDYSPISTLPLIDRLLTSPSIVIFYLKQFLFPMHLATQYYWTNTSFSITNVLLPLILIILIIAILALIVKNIRKTEKSQGNDLSNTYTFYFFAIWTCVGILMHSQFIALDMTASETWFYFPIIGLLGMVGIIVRFYSIKQHKYYNSIPPLIIILVSFTVVSALGARTYIREKDWNSQLSLAKKDVANSKDNFAAYATLSHLYIQENKFELAKQSAQKSVNIHSNAYNQNNLGVSLMGLGDYAGAVDAFNSSLKLNDYYLTYRNLATITAVYGQPETNRTFLLDALEKYPSDPVILTYLAVLEYRYFDVNLAQKINDQVANTGTYNKDIHYAIKTKSPFTYTIGADYVYITPKGYTP